MKIQWIHPGAFINHLHPLLLLRLHSPLVFPHFIPVFPGNDEHTEAFAVFFTQVFVVHLMRPADSADIAVVAAGKPFEPLVNNHFMYQEIGSSVQGDSETNGCHPVHLVLQTQHDAEPAGDGKNEEEGIVFLKKARPFLVMVFMKVPKKTVHHIPVRHPGNAFHHDERKQYNEYEKKS